MCEGKQTPRPPLTRVDESQLLSLTYQLPPQLPTGGRGIFFLLFFIIDLIGLTATCSVLHAADFTSKLKTIEKTVDQTKVEAEALARKEQEQNAALADLREKLVEATESFEQKQEEQKALHDRLEVLSADMDAKDKAFADQKQNLRNLVIAFIELARQPPESLLLQHGLTEDHIHRMIYLRAILPRAHEVAENLGQDLVELHELKSHMARQARLMTASEENLNKQRQKLDQLIQMRQGYLQQTEEQKAEIQKQLVSLSSQANDLRQLLEKISPKQAHSSVPQVAPPLKLKWPVVGQQMRHFGDKDSDGVRSEGIAFSASAGAPVVAPAPGKVVFVGTFKGYGPIVILQHAGGYHSFLAGFGRIDAQMGEEVNAGEPLGEMPSKEAGNPELYFEWRHNNVPVDPVNGRM